MENKTDVMLAPHLAPMLDRECAGCGTKGLYLFYKQEKAPVHSVLLMESRERAVKYPRGDIALGYCAKCGFISNTAYDMKLHEYSPRCEETQGCSPTFNAFARSLAEDLVKRYDLRGKDIIEIGCGKGEFLTMLCDIGGNHGVGFDPAFAGGRVESEGSGNIEFVQDFYSEAYSGCKGDFIVCKMTLEHIADPARMLRTMRSSMGDKEDSVLFLQVPDMARILKGLAFWDIYYEHCSYFTAGSLSRLLRLSGFDVLDIRRDFDGQYIMCEARASKQTSASPLPDASAGTQNGNGLSRTSHSLGYFAENHMQKMSVWKHKLTEFFQTGYRTVIWGSGSKGVSFLTTLNIGGEIEYAVDINPRRQGTFMTGTGHEIISPDKLRSYRPDAVVVMNPVYRDEIKEQVSAMGLTPELITV